MTSPEVVDLPAGEEPSPGLRLIRDLRSFFNSSGHQALDLDRPCDWHCPACNVWGRDVRPAACWCCGTEDVDYRVAPSMTGGHRFRESNGQEGA
jgi:hypothetical protein